MSEPVFLTALVIAGATLVLVAGAIAGALRGRGSSRSEVGWWSFTSASTLPSGCWPKNEIAPH
jgi:hypothetical protein